MSCGGRVGPHLCCTGSELGSMSGRTQVDSLWCPLGVDAVGACGTDLRPMRGRFGIDLGSNCAVYLRSMLGHFRVALGSFSKLLPRAQRAAVLPGVDVRSFLCRRGDELGSASSQTWIALVSFSAKRKQPTLQNSAPSNCRRGRSRQVQTTTKRASR